MAKPKNLRGGRPPISDAKWAEVVEALKTSSPSDVAAATGVSVAKVYEIRRNPVRQDSAGGLEEGTPAA